MDFREKIDKVLTIKQVKLWKLAKESGLGTTLEKAYESNRPMRDSTTKKFLQNLGISKVWWETGKGEIIINQSNPLDEKNVDSSKDLPEVYLKYIMSLEARIEDKNKEISRLGEELAALKGSVQSRKG